MASSLLRTAIPGRLSRTLGSRHLLQSRCLSTETVTNDARKLTLSVPPHLRPGAVVEQLRKLAEHRDHAPVLSQEANAAVILATPTFAKWLVDESFMSALLASFTRSDAAVLAGVVDDLSPLTPYGSPETGFSIMRGSAEAMLPSFGSKTTLVSGRGAHAPAKLSFSLPRGVDAQGSLSVNLPLANTIFQNGKESTLLASTWRAQGQGSFALSNTAQHSTQDIVLPPTVSQHNPPALSVPLIPVTPPRKILGCLGNIISQVEVDGAPVPASTELENVVQGIYDRRAAAGNLSKSGMPVDIWALISTPDGTLTSTVEDTMSSLQAAQYDGPEEEAAVALKNANSVAELLMSGFQLHRITSGGGGWDKRRGRLSLDPNWDASDSGPEDLNMFLNSGADSGPAILQRGLVSPGSYIQFLTAPSLGDMAQRISSPAFARSVVLGTSAVVEADEEVPSREDGDVTCYWGRFGALSRRHFFLSEPATAGAGTQEHRVRTQVDSPYSYVSL